MSTTETPLRYPGGKSQLALFVTDLLRENNLLNGIYAEPFAGGSGLALRLLLSGRVSEIWLNDIDPAIYGFWHSVLYATDDLCEMIDRVPVNMDEWRRQREVLLSGKGDTLRLGFAALFLNRTNRSGILMAGVIGGKTQMGSYKIDCRFNKAGLIEKIRRIANYREVVTLSKLDALLCIKNWAKALPARGLMNIDPPYFVKGQELYTNFYTPDNHRDLSKTIRRLKCNWMLTYDDVPEVRVMYAGLPMYRKGLHYFAQVKRQANELLVVAPRLVAPASIAGQSLYAA